MKKLILILLMATLCLGISACSSKSSNKVVIFSSAEDFRNEHIIKRLNEQFPDYDITLQYQSTGNNAAKLKAEGKKTECDIVIGLDSAYLEQIKDNLADLSGYDSSAYLEELVPSHKKYLTWERFSGCIAINPKVLEEKGLSAPKSYEDLLKPDYMGLISMPNPKASGTGYFFYLNRVNTMGKEAALEYFDKLSSNILQYTSSGSGPVNALLQGEVAIGLGMTFQTVNEINEGAALEIYYFDEGAPYSTCGFAIIDGKQENVAVKEVFDFLQSTLIYEDKEKFSPEQIFKEQIISISNYPNVVYGDMTGISDVSRKEELLAEWKY